MTEVLRITYINCDFCTAKNHCAACGSELEQSLTEKPGIASAKLNIPDHTASIEHTLDGDDLEDLLDAMGLLVG
ncbi:MAG: heavy-metal-associated domain-containing protein [Oscillospiraceae bacterium]|nr:heavy-metal-associated domain-containing protein [Oscillospiraceae bacterium]